MKHGEISDDGQIQATTEHYIDGNTSVARVTANFRGKTGAMTFRATADGVAVSFSGDDVNIGAAGDLHMTGDNAVLTANKASLDAEDELVISSGGHLIVQALGGYLNLISSKKMNIGTNDSLEINSLKSMVIKTMQQLQVVAQILTLQVGIMRVGTGIFPVARVGDSVIVDGIPGTIVGPGSTKLFTD